MKKLYVSSDEDALLERRWGYTAEAAEATDEEILAQPCVVAALQRAHDLVRHQRGALHQEGLISDAEYATLAGDHGAVARLEGYDAATKAARHAGQFDVLEDLRLGVRVAEESGAEPLIVGILGGVATVAAHHFPDAAPTERA